MPSLRKAVENAMMAKDDRGKMYSHQCLVGADVLAEAAPLVLGAIRRIRRCTSFDELYSLIKGVTEPVFRFGPLATYDTSIRIGAFRDILPDKVYMHCGTRKGARIVSPGLRGDVISMESLPPVIGRYLTPHEAENFLCFLANRVNGSHSLVRC